MAVDVAKALERAVGYLVANQADDGGWHSRTYGALRDGAALTALGIYALAHLPPKLRQPHVERVAKACKFLKPAIDKHGYVASPDGTLDYPTYGSAMIVTASRRIKLPLAAGDVDRLVGFLIDMQVGESREFEPDHVDYGGWDLMAPIGPNGKTTGTNVSIACFVLEALRDAKHKRLAETLGRANKWAGRCQNLPDGGFVFQPNPSAEGNKAGWTDKEYQKPRSYGTATCDGLRCLLDSGAKADDPRVVAAVKWLAEHDALDAVPGFDKSMPKLSWQDGLRFYYWASLAKTLGYLPADAAKKRHAGLAAAVEAQIGKDGGCKNESSKMREDDSLVATALAIVALGELASSRQK